MNVRAIAFSLPLVVAGSLVLTGTPEAAFAEDRITNAEHCISIRRIQSTDVVDDQRILFYMAGNEVYLNELPHKCPGLEWEDTFMYRTSIGQLCDMDIVTVLLDAPFGFQPGASCGLGMFHPITADEAEQIKAAAEDD